ncbi:hypothetical protein AK812_SmicGene34708 [Symbiodinium microadriaticum]|uniref:Uncharacterized protein n=1 Tax=Symbiodinium microadriaticum TaxID=2951 RepID=A0A1Q9CNC8_SYMMI|nr:hypothetical protein AK812_SmicGene34708 [Symbiodinium microadriaticum]
MSSSQLPDERKNPFLPDAAALALILEDNLYQRRLLPETALPIFVDGWQISLEFAYKKANRSDLSLMMIEKLTQQSK